MADDFIESQGRAFLAHRLRRSSERIVEGVGAVLLTEGLSVPPRGASMLLLIDEQKSIGVVEISRRLRLSHPLIVRMAQRFEAAGAAIRYFAPPSLPPAKRITKCFERTADQEAAIRRRRLFWFGGSVAGAEQGVMKRIQNCT